MGPRPVVLLLLLAAVAPAGCGSSDTKTVTAAGTPATTAAGAPTSTSTPSTASAPSTGPALAERDGQIGGNPVHLKIVELKRANDTTTLQLNLTTTSDKDSQVAQELDDGIGQKSTAPDAGSQNGSYELDGIYLVDGVNRKKYLVGRDSQNLCTCDTGLASFVRSSAPLTLGATFGAPPPDVKKIDVFIPRFGTFRDVPLG